MLLKIIGFIAILVLIYIFFFKKKRKEDIQKSREHEQKKLEGDTMVECKHCATFVSHNEAIIKDGCYFCSKECAGVLR